MGFYKVNFGEYSLVHSDSATYFDHFEFNGKKYLIGAPVKLTDEGMNKMFHNGIYNYVKGDFRLVDHYVTEKGCEEWVYIIGWRNDGWRMPVFHSTNIKPEVLISEVIWKEIDETVHTPGELQVEFKEPNYFPKDSEVEGVTLGWIVLVVVMVAAFIFKDWWIRLLIWVASGIYFGNWREKQINEAITKQRFKKKD